MEKAFLMPCLSGVLVLHEMTICFIQAAKYNMDGSVGQKLVSAQQIKTGIKQGKLTYVATLIPLVTDHGYKHDKTDTVICQFLKM